MFILPFLSKKLLGETWELKLIFGKICSKKVVITFLEEVTESS